MMQADEHWYVKYGDSHHGVPSMFFRTKEALLSWLKTQHTEGISEPFESSSGNIHVFINKGSPSPEVFERVKVVVNE